MYRFVVTSVARQRMGDVNILWANDNRDAFKRVAGIDDDRFFGLTSVRVWGRKAHKLQVVDPEILVDFLEFRS